MAIRNCLSAILVFFLFFAAPPSEASLLSQQYTSVWTASDFFPIQSPVFRIGSVKNETGHDASFDMLGYLSEQTRQQLTSQGFREDPSDPNAIVIELRVLLFQEGSTFGRWVGAGLGVAYAVVYAAFSKQGQPPGAEMVTVSDIGGGGLFSAGAEKTVLEDAASEIAAFLKGGNKK